MDWQLLFNVAVPIVGGLVTLIVLPWLKSIREDASDAIKQVSAIREEFSLFKFSIAEKYVTHREVSEITSMLSKMSDKLEGWMQHINDRLDRKQDR